MARMGKAGRTDPLTTNDRPAPPDDGGGPHPEGEALLPALVWRTRRTATLLRSLVPREFKIRYRESYLDVAWVLITPLVLLAVYGVILTQAFDAGEEGCGPYVNMAWIGLVVWTFFAGALFSAVTSYVNSSDLLSKIYFPREAIPLAEVGVSLVDLGLGLITVFALNAVSGLALPVTALGVIPAVIMIVVWSAGLGVLWSLVTVFVRDVAHMTNLVLRAGFFATPVMYDVGFYPAELRWLAVVNPAAVAIVAIRDCLLCGRWPNWSVLGIQTAVGCVILVVAVILTRRYESDVVDAF